MHYLRATLSLCLLAMLAACSTLPSSSSKQTQQPSPASTLLQQQQQSRLARIQQFSLQGRLGVQADGKGYSATVLWQHSDSLDDIRLYSPLGSQLARIQKNVQGINLEDAQGRVISGKDAESLTQAVLGWRLPLNGLADWVLSRPANATMASQTWDEAGLNNSLNEANWVMSYQGYQSTHGQMLPHKIALKNQRVQLKLIVEKWVLE
ncbi:MAG: lipoprotein insertase outer membrane protein LolB [Methylotenera sp.]|nr:lipoprotein insertase outer membrane protein LolB [Methylotenera sp.]